MGKFDFISDIHTRTMISNGYSAVSQLELWEWMRNFSTNERFMRTKHPNAYRIIEKMSALPDNPIHSGASFSQTMLHLEFIAKHGIQKYRETFY
jgi:hypothetical protein